MKFAELKFKDPLISINLTELARKEEISKELLHYNLTADLIVKYRSRERHNFPIGWIRSKINKNDSSVIVYKHPEYEQIFLQRLKARLGKDFKTYG